MEKKKFARRTVGFRSTNLYLWSPDLDKSVVTRSDGNQIINCTATSGSQGYDDSVNYVYNLVVVDGKRQKLAYVECDYVQ